MCFAIRCKNEVIDSIKNKLNDWHDLIWANKSDCAIIEYTNGDLKKKTLDNFNGIFEKNRLKALEWVQELIKQEWYAIKEIPKHLLDNEKVHQPIKHYVDGKML